MVDIVSVIPSSVYRNLFDKLYEKRKIAALEIEALVRQLAGIGDYERVATLIKALAKEMVPGSPSNHRKGGLIGASGIMVGMGTDASRFLGKILEPVFSCFSDPDSTVRYYACETLYNIAKVVRGDLIAFFTQIFDLLCKLSADPDSNVQSAAHLLNSLVKDIVTESDNFSVEEFIPLLTERMDVFNPFVRQFLIGWITVLDSVPDIDMLGFLPDFLDGLFDMLSDPLPEIRQQADSALSEFLEEIKNLPSLDYDRMAEILVRRAVSLHDFTRQTSITWMNELVKLGGHLVVPYYANILGVILPCISDKEQEIRAVAHEINEELQSIIAEQSDGINIGEILFIATRQLSNEWEATRIEALLWIRNLLTRYRSEVVALLDDIFDALLRALSDPSDKVVLLVLDVHARIAVDALLFHQLAVSLLQKFRIDQSLLHKRGALIICQLCVSLDAERVYRDLARILEREPDLDFASIMVQALNMILLTSSELYELRALLKQSLVDTAGRDFFISLYSSWCHSSTALLSLCLLAQAYQHASCVIWLLVEEDINAKFLVQLDKLICLLETPVFSHIRLQLLEPSKYMCLLKVLYGLLMLLPQQSAAFRTLRTRLKTVPSSLSSVEQLNMSSDKNYDVGIVNERNFDPMIQKFEHIRNQHKIRYKLKLHPVSSESST
ncbi:hypothetical protein Scep_022748 [Stephania cephalantha]|uniref:Vacuolar protein 14 C-terminal Fig4-binding domain-containing protein n=1 Tax=Stephania cephalantha TaxID=152367 RepID=A0AAP0F6S9_9MAGN